MIITRTPFRISFFGGGTDYPSWFNRHGGAVLATTIDKYCYLSCRYLPPFFDARYRTVYSQIELTRELGTIQHPSVRECLRYLDFAETGTEIVHYSDLPSRTGIGSSSSFTVGLLHALLGLKGKMPSKRQLASMAIDLEQRVLCEAVGSQDQVLAAFGGFNLISFSTNGFELRPMTLQHERFSDLQASLMMVYTGISRTASEIAAEKIANFDRKEKELREMRQMVDAAVAVLTSTGDLSDFGRLLGESWRLKRDLADRIRNDTIDEIYDKAMAAGARGGKLLGAGGGGFMLFFVEPERRATVSKALEGILQVPFSFESLGSQVIYFHQQQL